MSHETAQDDLVAITPETALQAHAALAVEAARYRARAEQTRRHLALNPHALAGSAAGRIPSAEELDRHADALEVAEEELYRALIARGAP